MMTFEEQKDFVSRLNLTDDIFFRFVFKDMAACEEVARVILKNPNLKVVESSTQREFPNLGARSAVVDLYCEDADGRQIDIEMQTTDERNCVKRTRFIRCCMTLARTKTSTNYKDIPDVCTIFITTFDPFDLGDTVYEVERRMRSRSMPVPNGEFEIYINTVNDDGSDIARLMRYFVCSTSEGDAMFPALSSKVRSCKENPTEVADMCDTVQQYAESYAEKVRKEERECAEQRGKEERQRLLRSLQIMLTSGVPMQKILVAFPQLSSEEIACLQ